MQVQLHKAFFSSKYRSSTHCIIDSEGPPMGLEQLHVLVLEPMPHRYRGITIYSYCYYAKSNLLVPNLGQSLHESAAENTGLCLIVCVVQSIFTEKPLR